MDQFITIQQPKKTPEYCLTDRDNLIHILQKILKSNDVVCLYGPSGVGKTVLVHAALAGQSYIDFESEMTFRESRSHVLVDDFSVTNKDFLEYMRISQGRLSLGATIIITQSVQSIDFCNCLEVPKLSIESLMKIGMEEGVGMSPTEIAKCAERCDGNVRNFLDYIHMSAQKDLFESPKQIITRALTTDIDPISIMRSGIEEHGYTWGIVHDNYVDAPLELDVLEEIAESMSRADEIDNRMFHGEWEYSPYFALHAVVLPVSKIKGGVPKKSLRPGSMWTKFNNFKMRDSNVRSIRKRSGLQTEDLELLKTYCLHDISHALKLFQSYNLSASDLDIINHLSVVNKIKTRALNNIKKSIKALDVSSAECP